MSARKEPPPHSLLSRRHVFAGAGAAGALAVAATVLPDATAPADDAGSQAGPGADNSRQGGGYRVTQHVLRYYQTTRV